MNNVAGIDVSKGKSMVSVLRPFGEVVAKPFSIGHTGSELKELADYLKSLDGETRVVMEHTGRYYEPVARFLHDEGVFVSAVNPKLIKDYGNNTLRKVKTDKADSRKIARYGIDNWAELRQHTPMDTIRMQLKTLNRQITSSPFLTRPIPVSTPYLTALSVRTAARSGWTLPRPFGMWTVCGT